MSTLKRYTGSQWDVVGAPIQGLSGSTLAYAEITTTATLGNIGGETPVPGLSVTVTVPEGRRLRISGVVHLRATGTDVLYSRIKADGASLGFSYINEAGTSPTPGITQQIITPTAGTHTYSISVNRASGSASVSVYGAVGEPSYILVEDITGTGLPYNPASVPVGLLAQAYKTNGNQTITAAGAWQDIVGLSINISVPAGRVIKLTASGGLFNATAGSNQVAAIAIYEGATQLGVAFQPGNFEPTGTYGDSAYGAGEVIISPTAGSHTYNVKAVFNVGTTNAFTTSATQPAFLIAEDITPTPASSTGAPGSTLGYAEVLASQSSITTETDLTGLSVTVTVPAGRRLRISAKIAANGSAASSTPAMNIKEGATTLQNVQVQNSLTAGNGTTLVGDVIVSPSAGTHTYKLTLQLSAGSGTVGLAAGPTFPAFILVEDVTGSVWPTGSAVTGGMIASEPFGTWSPVITQGVTPTQTVNGARYQKIGRLVHAFFSIGLTSAGTASTAIKITNLPFAPASNAVVSGTAHYFDAGNTNFLLMPEYDSASSVVFERDGFGNLFGLGDITIANTDSFNGVIIYESAT